MVGIRPAALVVATGALFAQQAKALEVVPRSFHQSLSAYGILEDYQTAVLRQLNRRLFGQIGGTIALLGWSDFQFAISGSVTSTSALQNGAILTQTVDSRTLYSFDTALGPSDFLRVGFAHASGHVGDDVFDRDLLPLNVDVHSLVLRWVHWASPTFRFGATLSPIYNSDPKMKLFSANQFADFDLPWLRTTRGALYVALGAEQYGHHQIDTSEHMQIGYRVGERTPKSHVTTGRAVLGYYTGPDLGLKNYLFRGFKSHFFYAGFMADF
ncbi:hypothetical protein EB061_12635 [bacterium]|nr:hypothetical protein [bacterium]